MNACLIVSTFPPRKCGIATFSNDLRDNLKEYVPEVHIAAVNDPFLSHQYSAEVVFELEQDNIDDYIACATWANDQPNLDLVIIQHEYGIFGGENGEHVIGLAANLVKPFLLVTHTVLPNPSIKQKEILSRLAELAAGVICMTERARSLLADVYGVNSSSIHIVHHGVPNFIPNNRDALKAKYGLQERDIITTFGLIGPGKGLEMGIKAVAKLIPEHPRVLYTIAGATHPTLLRYEGERYRESIMQIVADLQMEKHVRFDNRYLEEEQLGDYLYMTDIYLSPYPNLDQAVSGTLAFAVGCGRAIVSTPYEYAREILAEGRGMITEEPTPEALAGYLDLILKHPGLKHDLEIKASKLGRTLNWSSVAEHYYNIAEEISALDNGKSYRTEFKHLKKYQVK